MAKRILFQITFLFIFLFFIGVDAVFAQVLKLVPQTATKKVGEELSIDLTIDTNSKPVAGTDVKITFDAETIEIVSVASMKAAKESGGFFTEGAYNLSAGNLYLAGFFGEQFKTDTGTGKVATIKIKGKKVGSGQLVFACTTQTNDTNILDAQAGDIINCAGTQNGVYTFVADSGSSPTTAPTSTPVPGSPTATPTIPVSGMAVPTLFA
ncbi:MAG: cohesin domain-containing protein, partial [Candidatus Komeilibacteria bacterium]|nr:cohesin domain-containing protein [Candidatus Komeilibacteria bacterium]